jgi:hypothetical protein
MAKKLTKSPLFKPAPPPPGCSARQQVSPGFLKNCCHVLAFNPTRKTGFSTNYFTLFSAKSSLFCSLFHSEKDKIIVVLTGKNDVKEHGVNYCGLDVLYFFDL